MSLAPTPPEPFKRPRYRSPAARTAALAKFWAAGPVGDCYRYAIFEAAEYIGAKRPRPALRLVHGTVWNALLELDVNHAWVERGGFAYDWQTFALNRDGVPLALATFYKKHRAKVSKVYTASQALKMLKHGHYGPWEVPS
jgi:hypothetical protein